MTIYRHREYRHSGTNQEYSKCDSGNDIQFGKTLVVRVQSGIKSTSVLVIMMLAGVLFSSGFAQDSIRLNQVGYYPDSEKIAVLTGGITGEFRIRDISSDDVVFTGTLAEPKTWSYSGESVSVADFSALTLSGSFVLENDESGVSHEFRIGPNVYHDVSAAALKAYYYNRASTALPEEFAGKWARPAGHPDTNVLIHASAVTDDRPAGFRFNSSKGWYDAGDFNKYIVNSGISTYTLMAAWEHFPAYFDRLEVSIPETGNGIPDILNEARWNLDWMITMQDPHDGGVYHKLTSANFAGMVMPHQNNVTRYAVMKSTAATLNFAAVMAVASRVYEPFDPVFADSCLDAAVYAWQWALQNPAVYYNQNQMNQNFNPNINTGEYGDSNVSDEFDWAAAELYITSGDDAYWEARNFASAGIGVPSWQSVRALAWISLNHHSADLTQAANISLIEQRITSQGNTLRQQYNTSAYRVSMGHMSWEFLWGSNAIALNHSVLLIQAWRLTGDESYLQAASANFDYILGRNATGYSFVTGHGSHTPRFPHHRQSAADGIADPVPGFVVGGPHSGQQDGCAGYPSDLPARSYLDSWCSYSTNEVTINWNAPLAYMAGALEAIYNDDRPATDIPREGEQEVPAVLELGQNYPNPFNPETRIPVTLHATSRIKISIYDVLGRLSAVAFDGSLPAGRHSVTFDANGLPTGLYLYTLEYNGQRITRKMTFIK
jgi:endoglucanase